jgi:hypothetical protein
VSQGRAPLSRPKVRKILDTTRRMRATRKLDELRRAQKETIGLQIFQRMAVEKNKKKKEHCGAYTGSSSPGEVLMTCSTADVAV